MTEVTATLTINFTEPSESTSSQIKIEIDSREDGLNEGVTNFRPGDSPGYLVFMPPGMTLIKHEVSAGVIASEGSGSLAVNTLVSFGNSKEASLSYPAGSISTSWHGKSGGSVRLLNPYQIGLDNVQLARVLRVQYSSAYRGFRIKNIPSDIEQILVAVTGEI